MMGGCHAVRGRSQSLSFLSVSFLDLELAGVASHWVKGGRPADTYTLLL